jgi:DNA mismatch repair protein MutH
MRARLVSLLLVLAIPAMLCPAVEPEEGAVTRRSVDEALPWLEALAGQPFKDLADAHELRINLRSKGCTGLLLEQLLALPRDNRTTDFLDAELKTCKSSPDGDPLETMYITQIAGHIDELLAGRPYAESWLARKIRRIVFLPVVKEGPPEDWYFLSYRDVFTGPGCPFFELLEADYQHICRQMVRDIEATGELRTASGRYLQIRTKDKMPYTPIRSQRYGKEVADKNYAFYFRKAFMREAGRLRMEKTEPH